MKNFRFTLIALAIAGFLFLLATMANAAPVAPGMLYDASMPMLSMIRTVVSRES